MKRNYKRVMAIHDLSGLGRSSLMAVTPVLSVMGAQVCPVPTAILSTQTSGFTDYTFVDLTSNMPSYLHHWKQLGMDFDCIYSGFLGSVEQISIMEEIVEDFSSKNTFVVVDPVLGDDGELYDTMDEVMVERMRHLIGHADMILPNVTEVKLLLGIDQKQPLYAEEMEPYLKQLAQMGPKVVVATGVYKKDGGRCVCYYQCLNQQYDEVPYQELPVSYPGTGDIFASVVIGGLIQGRSLAQSIHLSADFICYAVADAMEEGEPVRNGVQLEKNLYRLVQE